MSEPSIILELNPRQAVYLFQNADVNIKHGLEFLDEIQKGQANVDFLGNIDVQIMLTEFKGIRNMLVAAVKGREEEFPELVGMINGRD